MLTRLARDRVARNYLTPGDEKVLQAVVKLENASTSEISKAINKSKQYTSRTLVSLAKNKLVTTKRHGRNKYYFPALDAVIAYSN